MIFLCFAGTNFCDKDRDDSFSGINFCDFHKVPDPGQRIFSFLMITCNRNT